MQYDNNMTIDSEDESGLPLYDIEIENIRPNPKNPNSMTDEKFSYLAESIEEKGFDMPIIVVEDPDDDEETDYMIIDGEHRWKAAKSLGYESVPAVIKKSLTEKDHITETVRRNTIVGTLEQDKVERIITELSDEWAMDDEEELARELGMDVEDELESYIQDEIAETEKEIEEDIEEELDEEQEDSEQEVNMVDNLSTTLNDLMSKYGETIPQSFMIFAHPDGGIHMMVGMNEELKDKIMQLAKKLRDNEIDANEKFSELIDGEIDDVEYIDEEFFEAEFAVDPYD